MKRFVSCIVLVVLLMTVVSTASARKWTDYTGKFSIEAELVEVKDGKVKLKNQKGKFITVLLARLSKADRDYLASLDKPKEKPKAKPTRTAALAAIEKLGGSVNNIGIIRKKMTVDLSETKVTDADLKLLKGLTNLTELYLNDTKITDAGLEHLEELTMLKVLFLKDTKITGDGLKYLIGMTKLLSLNLSYTEVSDAGLEHLHGLTKLQWMKLGNSKVTDDGVKKLQQALPKCNISYVNF